MTISRVAYAELKDDVTLSGAAPPTVLFHFPITLEPGQRLIRVSVRGGYGFEDTGQPGNRPNPSVSLFNNEPFYGVGTFTIASNIGMIDDHTRSRISDGNQVQTIEVRIQLLGSPGRTIALLGLNGTAPQFRWYCCVEDMGETV